MKTVANFVFAVVIVFLSFLDASAQTATSSNQTSTSAANVFITKNGDKLCTISNGNMVPCEWESEAEKSIVDERVAPILCNTSDGGRAPCSKLDSDGDLKIKYKFPRIFGFILYFRYKIMIATGVLLSLLIIFYLYKKYENKK